MEGDRLVLPYCATTSVQLCDVLVSRSDGDGEDGDGAARVYPPLADTWLLVQETEPAVTRPRLVRPPNGFRVYLSTGNRPPTEALAVGMARQLWNKYSFSPHHLALRARVAALQSEASLGEDDAAHAVATWHRIYGPDASSQNQRLGPPVNFVTQAVAHAAANVVELELPSFHAARFVAHWVRQYGAQKGLADTPCTLRACMGGARYVDFPANASLDALLLAQLPTWTAGVTWTCAPIPTETVVDAGDAVLLGRPHVEFELHHLAREATMQDYLRRAMARAPSLWLRAAQLLPPTRGVVCQTLTRVDMQVALKRAREEAVVAPVAKKARSSSVTGTVAAAPVLEAVRARIGRPEYRAVQQAKGVDHGGGRNLGPNRRPVHDVSIKSFLRTPAPKEPPGAITQQ